MNDTSLHYWDFSHQEEESVFSFFLVRLLHKNGLWEEEHKEVNVYVAGLLLKRIQPSHLLESEKYLLEYESDMIHRLDHSQDRAEQYHCLKFNADYLLVDSGIFLNEGDKKLPRQVDRGKTYYRWTANCAQHIYRKQTGLTQIFDHLSNYFEEYQTRLKRLRKSYFQFVNKLSVDEKESLFSEVQQMIDPS